MAIEVVWKTMPKFGWQAACCFKCCEPLIRLRHDVTNRPGFWCCHCQILIEHSFEDRLKASQDNVLIP